MIIICMHACSVQLLSHADRPSNDFTAGPDPVVCVTYNEETVNVFDRVEPEHFMKYHLS